MGFFGKAKSKIEYERESYKMGREHLKRVKADSPDLYVKGWWRKTDAQRRKEAGK